jgi:hypothetical protein
LFTEQQIQAQGESQRAAIESANKKISAAVSNATTAFSQIPSTYLQCSANRILSIFPIFGSSSSSSSSCLNDAAAQLQNLTNQVSAAIQSAVQQAQTQASATKSDKSLQSAAAQYQHINEEIGACVQDAVDSNTAASDASNTASASSDTSASSSDTAESA